MSYHGFHACEACGCPGVERGYKFCGACSTLLAGIDQPDPPAREVESEAARRERFHAARVAHVKQEWERGRRQLLARGLNEDERDPSWSRPQPR